MTATDTQTPWSQPFDRFEEWFEQAKGSEVNDPNAMSLATVDEGGQPSVRIVLLKDFSQAGFVFYTNTLSRKGRALAHEPRAALAFHWKTLQKQVRIEGLTEPVSDEEADAYYQSRARGSRLGAWASHQSQALSGREELVDRWEKLQQAYPEGEHIPRPPHWSGYRLKPTAIELWQDGEFRLHQRWRYELESAGQSWRVSLLNP